MIRDIVIKDEDQGRDYHCQVRFSCREEIGGAPGVCCDVDGVIVEKCVVWFGKWGEDLYIDSDRQEFVNRWVAEKYANEIVEQCIAHFERERFEAA